MDLIFVGGLLGVICSALVIFGTWRHNKQSSEKSTRIESGVSKANEEVAHLRQQNDSLKADLELQLNKIDELRRENADLYAKLAKSSHEIYNNLTGGDGNKPILTMSATGLNVDKSKSKPSYYMVQFSLSNKGKYPLKNVVLRIVDGTGRDMLQYGVKHTVDGQLIGFNPNTTDEYNNYEFNKTFRIESISPNVIQLLYRTTYSPEITPLEPFYNIEVSWDNGHFIYLVHLKNKDGRLMLEKVETIFNSKVTKNNKWFKFE